MARAHGLLVEPFVHAKQRPGGGKNNKNNISQKTSDYHNNSAVISGGKQAYVVQVYTNQAQHLLIKTNTGYQNASNRKREFSHIQYLPTNQSHLVPDAQSSCIAIQWIYNIADGWLLAPQRHKY